MEYEILKTYDDATLAHILDLSTLAMAGHTEATAQLRDILQQPEDWLHQKPMLALYKVTSEAYECLSNPAKDKFDRQVEAATECRPIPAQPDPKKITSPLASLRIAHGWTQTELANAAGITLRQVQRLENGESRIGAAAAENVLGLADALGVTVRRLITGIN